MKENVVHITVGCIFDVYVKGLINKETYDACIESYKEYQQAKQGIVHNEPELTPALYHSGTGVDLSGSIETIHVPADGKWREGPVIIGDAGQCLLASLPKGTKVFNTDDTLATISYIQQSYKDK